MPTQTKQRQQSSHKKRHGLHHPRNKHYVRVYWPYLPLIAVIAFSLLMSFSPKSWNVLAYATNLSHKGLLDSTNAQRGRYGRRPLTLNDRLNSAAQAKANDMATRNYWSHNTPEGGEPWEFVVDAGYAYEKAGENLAYGFSSAQTAVNGWMNSQTHRENLLDASYQEVGFGYANVPDFQDKGEVTIIVAMYGDPLISAEPSLAPVEPSAVQQSNANKPVSIIQALAGTRAAWLPFGIGLLTGLSAALLFIKNGLAIRRLAVRSETYILHHPLFDLGLVLIIIVGLLLTRTAGFIR